MLLGTLDLTSIMFKSQPWTMGCYKGNGVNFVNLIKRYIQSNHVMAFNGFSAAFPTDLFKKGK